MKNRPVIAIGALFFAHAALDLMVALSPQSNSRPCLLSLGLLFRAPDGTLRSSGKFVFAFVVLSICNALLVVGTIFVAIYPRSTIARIAGLTATIVVVGLIDYIAIKWLIPGGDPGEFLLIYVPSHLVLLLLSMGWVRYLAWQ